MTLLHTLLTIATALLASALIAIPFFMVATLTQRRAAGQTTPDNERRYKRLTASLYTTLALTVIALYGALLTATT